MPPSDLPALNTFAAVVRHGSFRGAARDLGVSPSAVSHAVAGLEQRLGLRLLHRTTRSLALTPEGRVLLDGLSPALERIDEALDAARSVGPGLAGSVRIAAPELAAHAPLMPLVVAFRARFPRVEVAVRIVEDGPDNAAQGGDGDTDFRVRIGDAAEAQTETLALGAAARQVLVAAPSYRDAHRLPSHPGALADHSCIGRLAPDGAIRPWTLRRGGERLSVTPPARLALESAALLRSALLAGAGIAQAPEPALRADIEAGRLVEVLPGWAEPPRKCSLHWPRGLSGRPATAAFIAFLRRAGEPVLAWQGRREG